MVLPVDSLTGLIPVVVTAGVVHKVTENVFGATQDREAEFDEEDQKRKERNQRKKNTRRRTKSSEESGEGSIFDDLSNTSFDDFG